MRIKTIFRNIFYDGSLPGTCFITHAKAGSTWIDGILRTLYGARVMPRSGNLNGVTYYPEKIYSALFITREELSNFPQFEFLQRFFVMRDLRDTLCSRYFSIRYTHGLSNNKAVLLEQQRKELNKLSIQNGMIYLLENGLRRSYDIQLSWLKTGEVLYKYEEIISDPLYYLKFIFDKNFHPALSHLEIKRAIHLNSFEAKYGRRLGEVDYTSHGRTGRPGDWKNYFTRQLGKQFLNSFGSILVLTGYELDDSWVNSLPEEINENFESPPVFNS